MIERWVKRIRKLPQCQICVERKRATAYFVNRYGVTYRICHEHFVALLEGILDVREMG